MSQKRIHDMTYQEKIACLNRSMRIELADLLMKKNLSHANEICSPAVPRRSFYTKYGKRAIDIVVSGVALVLTSPINVLLAIGTFFDVGRPLIFKQERTGKDGKPFQIIKFRNMTNATNEQGELLPARERVTKFGSFVRTTSLDEFLNFWNVFKGDMSIVGPRPLKADLLRRLNNRHAIRACVRPGLECPFLRPLDHVPTWEERFENDVWYVENVSFTTDVRMFFGIVKMVFDVRTRRSRAGAKGGGFMGYDFDGRIIDQTNIPERYLDEVLMSHGEIAEIKR